MTQVIQQLTVFLEGGQNIVIPFNAEKPEILNPQIETFLKALSEKDKKEQTAPAGDTAAEETAERL